jgi:hypothetical protein
MYTVINIEKSVKISELSIASFSMEELCKKTKLKSFQDYKRKHIWTIMLNKTYFNVVLYAKTKGRAGQENKYDFPPPVDTELFFGNCFLVNQKSANDANSISNLTKVEWEIIYEKLFDGFDSCYESDTDDLNDDDCDVPTDKNGYELDGFVIEDEEDSVEEEEEEYETDEEEIIVVKQKKQSKKKSSKKEVIPMENEQYLGCESELEEESYFTG